MPLYLYKCPKCGAERELLQKHDEPNPFCHVCETLMEKEISAPAGFQFNGSGFYQTDFKNK